MPALLTVAKALNLLEVLAASAEPLGTRELARRLGDNATTIHNLVKTLGGRGYMVRDPATGRHRLGPRFLLLGRHSRFHETLRLLAQPALIRVAQELKAPTMLALFLEGRALRLEFIDPTPSHRQGEPDVLGAMAYATAVGKLMLSTLSAAELDAYFRDFPPVAYTAATLIDPVALRREIAMTRVRGYARTNGEGRAGVAALAVRVLDPDGRVVAALGASGPRTVWRGAARDQILTVLCDAASAISSAWFQPQETPC